MMAYRNPEQLQEMPKNIFIYDHFTGRLDIVDRHQVCESIFPNNFLHRHLTRL